MTMMLEKAARALLDRAGYTEYGPIVPESLAADLVRAVLMAVREPDERTVLTEMQCAPLSDKARAATNTFDRMNASTEAMWKAGIDAILSEPQP